MDLFFSSMGTWDLRTMTQKGKNKALSFVKAPKVGSGAYFSPNTGNKLIYTTNDNFVRYDCFIIVCLSLIILITAFYNLKLILWKLLLLMV